MKTMDITEMRVINAGTTYTCPFGCNYTDDYWSVYYHCLKTKCFKNNFWLESLYYGGSLGWYGGKFLRGLHSFLKNNGFYATGKRYK